MYILILINLIITVNLLFHFSVFYAYNPATKSVLFSTDITERGKWPTFLLI